MTEETYTLDYALYDRQMAVFCNMMEAFVAGWDICSASELSMDIHSLCFKASRLCYMADLDKIDQQEKLIGERFVLNQTYYDQLGIIVFEQLSPLMSELVSGMKEGTALQGTRLPRFKGQFAEMLPHLSTLLADKNEGGQLTDMCNEIGDVQKAIQKLQKQAQPYGEKPILRFWHLCELYTYTCYLYFHFKSLVEQESTELPPAELERLFVLCIRNYANSEEGRHTLDTYRARLYFDNNNAPLTREQLNAAGRELVKDIPENLQLCYIDNRNNPGKMIEEVVRRKPSADELLALASAVAKWELLSTMIYELDHPQARQTIENTIFYTEMNGKPISLKALRTRIERMTVYIDRKNQWFCIWCVLKHHNLLADLHFEAFATQMMHPDWFGNAGLPTFKGDNISDFRDYFSATDYTRWEYNAFRNYRILHNKSEQKWSDSLFNTFHHLCYSMDEAFMEE